MDIKKKKEEVRQKFQEVTAQLNKLSQVLEQLRGQYMLLEEQEKENKSKSGDK